ncbi:serine hydrolase [Chryseobacterium sp. PCH239]|uniref:serine hydrolase domain-containing protein n=1 Tax=Chryseobacterium sp. PCH239 TaxID=2825845 RepID=UPI001C0FFCE2|nr:serine hydrolase [Chryseobacterium sp. PCH239]QWT86321.1 serine hydrolase [Chryseobacterium sp. PCH239]
MDINQPLKKYLTSKSDQVLSNAGYNTNSITLKHLLSHTSGIRDYVDEGYFKFIGEHPQHAWTRGGDHRAAGLGKPLSNPGEGFHYADINFVLLTEVIESVTHQPYYKNDEKTAGLQKARFESYPVCKFENALENTAPQTHQYWDQFGWDTYNLDPSWDLYGGGGIVTNVKEMAIFSTTFWW